MKRLARRRLLVLAALCALVLSIAGGVARADEDADDPSDAALRPKIEAWLEDLRSDSFATREEARASLQKFGLRARDLLEAAADDEDAEVRRTVRMILNEAGASTPAPKPGRRDVGKVGLVSLDLADVPLASALARLGGGRFEVPEALAGARVSTRLDGLPYFAALQALLDLHELVMPRPFDGSGNAILEPRDEAAQAPPSAAAGPVWFRVMDVTATRSLATTAPPRYSLNLEIRWPPHVQVFRYQSPTVKEARDRKGNAFRADPRRGITTYGVGGSISARTMPVAIEPTSAECEEHIAVLDLVVNVQVRHDLREVRFKSLTDVPACFTSDGAKAEPGTAGSVLLKSVERPTEDTRVTLVTELVATLASDVARNTAQVFVRWAGGSVQRLHVGGRSQSADGTLRLTARAYGRSTAVPEEVWVSWFERETSGDLSVRLKDIPLR